MGTTAPVITSLVKASTGLDKVNAESYLKQADEIFSAENNLKTGGISHPENFIRAKAIELWHQKKELAEEEIIKMIEGYSNLDQLDIFRQKDLADLTRKFIQLFLKPKWFQSTMVISQAKQYFTDFMLDEKAVLDEKTIETLSTLSSKRKRLPGLCVTRFCFGRPDSGRNTFRLGLSICRRCTAERYLRCYY